LSQLFTSPNGALALVTALSQSGNTCPPEIVSKAAQDGRFQMRELFERFLPDELRPRKLGLNASPEKILAAHGNAERGRLVFFREGVQCSQCHRIQGQGRDFGADLNHIGSKYTRLQLAEEILNPSKTIDPAFITYDIETADGRSYSGFIVKRAADEITLKDADLQIIRLPLAQIKRMDRHQLSAMPEGLLQAMTQQEAADLIEFLSSLR
jgi:putative heme-binding domain-containing protein